MSLSPLVDHLPLALPPRLSFLRCLQPGRHPALSCIRSGNAPRRVTCIHCDVGIIQLAGTAQDGVETHALELRFARSGPSACSRIEPALLTASTVGVAEYSPDFGTISTTIAHVVATDADWQLLHYSRIMPPVNGQRYMPSTAVLLNEIIKLAVSLTLSLYDISAAKPNMPATTLFANLLHIILHDSQKLAIPAMLYFLQQSLQYVAVSHLEASTYQIISQLRIPFAAAFSVMLLRRSLSSRKWISLLVLMLGVCVVSLPPSSDVPILPSLQHEPSWTSSWSHSFEDLRTFGSRTATTLLKRSASYQGIEKDEALKYPPLLPMIGFAATIAAALSCGLAGVVHEKVLKESRSGSSSRAVVSIWTRNVQLCMFSIIPALFIGVMFKDGEVIARNGFFAGYNAVVWAVVLLQALGGILVSFVINYADNVIKNFATSFSIVLSFLASVYLFGLQITFPYVVGTIMVLTATWMYNIPERSQPPSILINNVPPSEKTFFRDIESMSRSRSRDRLGDGLSTSRPTTPSGRRTPMRLRSPGA